MRRMPIALVLFIAILGCTPSERAKEKTAAKKMHDHPDHGPHGGPLIEWGDDQYHAEFTVDHDKKQSTVYVLDGTAKNPAPIAAETITLTLFNVTPPVEIVLKADPDKGDPKGSSSRFTGTHEKLGEKMDFAGEVSAKVGETPFIGTFETKKK